MRFDGFLVVHCQYIIYQYIYIRTCILTDFDFSAENIAFTQVNATTAKISVDMPTFSVVVLDIQN